MRLHRAGMCAIRQGDAIRLAGGKEEALIANRVVHLSKRLGFFDSVKIKIGGKKTSTQHTIEK
eukprot:5173658-Prymnesium_polylepis.1